MPDWRTIDWPAHEHSERIAGGSVNYVDMGRGEPAVVFIHGLGGNWRNWFENLPAVAEHRRTVALDLPGFGDSDLPAGGATVTGYARIVDELCDRLGLGRVVAVGNSLGGFIAAELALRHPERVERLVLVSAAGMVPTRRERWRTVSALWAVSHLDQRLAAANRHVAARPRLRRHLLKLNAHDPAALKADLVFHGLLDGARPAMRAVLKSTVAYISHEWGETLRQIEQPTAVVWGEYDALLPIRHAREYVRCIPHARAVTIADAGHIPMVERPAEFNAALLDFIRPNNVA